MAAENRKENQFIFTYGVVFSSKFTDSVQLVKVAFYFGVFVAQSEWKEVEFCEVHLEHDERPQHGTDKPKKHKSMNAFVRLAVSFLDIYRSFFDMNCNDF